MALTITNDFTAGNAIIASEMNTNFNDVETWAGGVAELSGATFSGAITANGGVAATTITASGTTTLSSTLTVGVNDTGYDVKFFGAADGKYMEWDESGNVLVINGSHGANALSVLDGNFYLADSADINGSVDIAGDLTLSGGGDGALQFATAGQNSIKIPDDQASALIIEEANNAYMTFTTTNSGEVVTFGKVVEFPNGSSSAPSITFDGDPDTGMYRAAADKVGIAGNIEMNTALVTFTSGGYATPRRLDVGETDAKQLKELVSSERFKKDIVDLPKEEAYKILDARPIKYRGVDDDSSVPLEAGLSAESLHEAGYEYAVRYDEGHWGTTPRNIYYEMLVAPLIAIVKDLNTRLSALES